MFVNVFVCCRMCCIFFFFFLQFLPFDCGATPTIFETNDGIIVIQGQECAYFKVIGNNLKWDIERLIWIAFYKNEKNEKCFIDKLPKDIIKHYIINFLGHTQQSIEKHASRSEIAFVKLGAS